MRIIFALLAIAALAGCQAGTDDGTAAAVAAATESFSRNIPVGQSIEFAELGITDSKGAVCGWAQVNGQPPERFWVALSDDGSATPVLERWEDDPSENDKLFKEYCKGMAPLRDPKFSSSAVGSCSDC